MKKNELSIAALVLLQVGCVIFLQISEADKALLFQVTAPLVGYLLDRNRREDEEVEVEVEVEDKDRLLK